MEPTNVFYNIHHTNDGHSRPHCNSIQERRFEVSETILVNSNRFIDVGDRVFRRPSYYISMLGLHHCQCQPPLTEAIFGILGNEVPALRHLLKELRHSLGVLPDFVHEFDVVNEGKGVAHRA